MCVAPDPGDLYLATHPNVWSTMHSEHHEGTRGKAAAQSGEAGCDKVFPAQFFAAVFHSDGGGTPVAPGARGIEVLARRRSGSEDDAADLAAVAAGRVAALEAIYDRHGDALYRLALLVAAGSQAAEDAVAGVFGALWWAPAMSTSGSRACVALSRARSTVAALKGRPGAICANGRQG